MGIVTDPSKQTVIRFVILCYINYQLKLINKIDYTITITKYIFL